MRPVLLARRDEPRPQVMPAPVAVLAGLDAYPERLQVVHRVARVDRRHVAGWHHEVIRSRCAAVDALPVRDLPRREDPAERRMHRHPPRHLGLRAPGVVARRDHQAPKRLQRRIVVAPPQPGDLAMPQPGDRLERVLHPALDRDPRVADQLLHLPRGERRRRAPLGILVDLRRQLAPVEHARVALDQLVNDRIAKHRVHDPVHAKDRARRHVAGLAQCPHHVAHVPGPHLVEPHRPQVRQHVVREPAAVGHDRAHSPRLALREPLSRCTRRPSPGRPSRQRSGARRACAAPPSHSAAPCACRPPQTRSAARSSFRSCPSGDTTTSHRADRRLPCYLPPRVRRP